MRFFLFCLSIENGKKNDRHGLCGGPIGAEFATNASAPIPLIAVKGPKVLMQEESTGRAVISAVVFVTMVI